MQGKSWGPFGFSIGEQFLGEVQGTEHWFGDTGDFRGMSRAGCDGMGHGIPIIGVIQQHTAGAGKVQRRRKVERFSHGSGHAGELL
jgi:hypothetical protein